MNNLDSFTWNLASPISPEEQLLTPVASISPTGTQIKVEWPYAVGTLDFPLFDSRETGPTVQTIYPSSVSAGVIQGQLCGLDEVDPALGPLERLQRKWGIGDRKTRDGAPAKRRGPKPDSKPAMTRRQELNRQAQRTHRERKENYMRELEIAIDRYKASYEKEVVPLREENKKLKELLAAHGIPHDFNSPIAQSFASPSSMVGLASGPSSVNGGGYAQSSGFTSPPHKAISSIMSSPSYPQSSPTSGSMPVPRQNIHGLDYDDVGLDFVGTLEQNCLQHKQYMVNRSVEEEDWVSGHALMATAPPRDHCAKHGMDVEYGHKMPDLPKPDLAEMLRLCNYLPGLKERNGELTPVMAWAYVLTHPACPNMTQEDFDSIKEDLKPKVACYGFGAVLENFEVEDSVHRVLTAKAIPSPTGGMDVEWAMISR